jgi:hypothetical protein
MNTGINMTHTGEDAYRDAEWIKETRLLTLAIIKHVDETATAAEQWGYRVAQLARIPTAHCFGPVKGGLAVQYLEGISCFEAICLMHASGDNEQTLGLLDALLQDVEAFQGAYALAEHDRPAFHQEPYNVERKLSQAFALYDPPPSVIWHMARNLQRFRLWFESMASVGFRDANPKNCILHNVSRDNLATVPDIPKHRRHIDFRSITERTTPADDYLSILLHHYVPREFRDQKLKSLNDLFGEDVVAGTAVIRLARLWGRRKYYHAFRPDLYAQRYTNESGSLRYLSQALELAGERAIDLGLFQ